MGAFAAFTTSGKPLATLLTVSNFGTGYDRLSALERQSRSQAGRLKG
jgi:hypothetical protein